MRFQIHNATDNTHWKSLGLRWVECARAANGAVGEPVWREGLIDATGGTAATVDYLGRITRLPGSYYFAASPMICFFVQSALAHDSFADPARAS
jgi:hypothetical protein